MVFSSAPQPRDTYTLFQRFSYPTENGLRDAIAVSATTGDRLNTVYTVLMGIMFSQIWEFAVIAAVYITNKGLEHPSPPTPPGKLNLRVDKWHSRLPELIWRLVKRAVLPAPQDRIAKREPRWFLYLWIILVGAAWLGPAGLSAALIPELIIGNGAPVAGDKIYFPQLPVATDFLGSARYVEVQIPAALRAVGNVLVANSTTKNLISLTTPPNLLMQLSNGDPVLEIGYNYSLEARDFGMQHFHGLSLNVQGSCYTEYGWFNASASTQGYDHYALWDDRYDFYNPVWVSQFDGWAPRAYFYPGNETQEGNWTYAIMISSANRTSFSIGTDPWYLTSKNATPPVGARDPPTYLVKPQRPVLSCWETAIWSFQGHNATVNNLTSIPGLGFPQPLQDALSIKLGQPMIINLGEILGTIALASSSEVTYFYFDAASSSTYADLERLILAAYFATSNVLIDSTLYENTSASAALPNLITSATVVDVAGFVVYSPDVTTFSLLLLILIPVLAFVLWATAKFVRPIFAPEKEENWDKEDEVLEQHESNAVEKGRATESVQPL